MNGADYARRLLWQYIQTGWPEQVPPGIEVQSSDPPQDKQKTEQRQFGHIISELLLMSDPDPIQYVERPEFRKEWKVRPVQFAPTIAAVLLTPQEEINSQTVIRGQKQMQVEEGFVGKGSGKNKNLNYVNLLNDSDMEADGEQLDEDESEKGEVRKKGKGMVDEGKKVEGQGKGIEQEEDTDVDD